MQKLTPEQISAALEALPGWSASDGKLHRDYRFADFIHAFGFMATSAIAIEKMDHHPDWSNSWNRVTVDLVTHSAGGITARDVELATLLESMSKRFL